MKMNRRSFIISSAAVTGGLALGFDCRSARPVVARARTARPKSTPGS